MGEYVRVACSKCKALLDDVWVEEIDKAIIVEIIPVDCECTPDPDIAYDAGYDAGYEDGVEAGRKEAREDE